MTRIILFSDLLDNTKFSFYKQLQKNLCTTRLYSLSFRFKEIISRHEPKVRPSIGLERFINYTSVRYEILSLSKFLCLCNKNTNAITKGINVSFSTHVIGPQLPAFCETIMCSRPQEPRDLSIPVLKIQQNIFS